MRTLSYTPPEPEVEAMEMVETLPLMSKVLAKVIINFFCHLREAYCKGEIEVEPTIAHRDLFWEKLLAAKDAVIAERASEQGLPAIKFYQVIDLTFAGCSPDDGIKIRMAATKVFGLRG